MDFRCQLTQNGVAVALSGHTHAFSALTGRPTTLVGYGITDAASAASLAAHTANTANPHSVTAAQAGALALAGGTTTGQIVATSNLPASGMANSAGNYGPIQVRGDGTYAAFMSFHRPGAWGLYFGLDTDNKLKVGGWSMGAAAYEILHAGNYDSYAPTRTGGGASGTWAINITGDAGSVDGLSVATAGATPGANQIVRTQGNGYAFVGYLNSSTANSENPTISQVLVTNGSDNYYRKASLAHLNASISPAWANVTGKPTTVDGAGLAGGTFSSSITVPYVTTTKNATGGYAFYDRTITNLWSLYAQDNICRIWSNNGDVVYIGNAGNMAIRQGLWSGCSLSVKGMGTSTSTYGIIVYDSNGANTFWVRDDGVGWHKVNPLTYSDARRKTQIADIDHPLTLISALRPRSFVMRNDPSEKLRYGLIAQEAITVVPSLVDLSTQPGQDEAEYSMDYVGLIGPLIGAVQELAARVIYLEEQCCP